MVLITRVGHLPPLLISIYWKDWELYQTLGPGIAVPVALCAAAAIRHRRIHAVLMFHVAAVAAVPVKSVAVALVIQALHVHLPPVAKSRII